MPLSAVWQGIAKRCPARGDGHFKLTAALDQSREFARHSGPRDRGVRDRREALPGNVVDHVEHPETVAIGELVVDATPRPARIAQRLDQDRAPCSDRLIPGLPIAHRQTSRPPNICLSF